MFFMVCLWDSTHLVSSVFASVSNTYFRSARMNARTGGDASCFCRVPKLVRCYYVGILMDSGAVFLKPFSCGPMVAMFFDEFPVYLRRAEELWQLRLNFCSSISFTALITLFAACNSPVSTMSQVFHSFLREEALFQSNCHTGLLQKR